MFRGADDYAQKANPPKTKGTKAHFGSPKPYTPNDGSGCGALEAGGIAGAELVARAQHVGAAGRILLKGFRDWGLGFRVCYETMKDQKVVSKKGLQRKCP